MKTRYLLFFLLFFGLLVAEKFGPALVAHFTPVPITSGPVEDASNIIIPPTAQLHNQEIGELLSGHFYRMTMQMKARTSDVGLVANDSSRVYDSKIGFTFIDKLSQEGQNFPVTVVNKPEYQAFEIKFQASADYSGLKISRLIVGGDNKIFMKDFKIEELNIDSAAQLDKVEANFVGQTDGSQILYKPEAANYVPYYTMANQALYGNVFQANADYFSGALFRFKIVGRGGLGKYWVELHQAVKDGDSFRVDPAVISSSSFMAASPDPTAVSGDSWRFNIPAFLQKNSYYFIGINTRDSQSNLFNNLKLYGSKSGSSSFKIDNGKTVSIGTIDVELYGADFSQVDNEKILTGAIFDNKGKNAYYSYQSSGAISDVLDLFAAAPTSNESDVSFDRDNKVVVGRVEDGVSFTYKFNTHLPIQQYSLEASQIGGDYTFAKMFYSRDNQHWQEIVAKEVTNQVGNLPYWHFSELIDLNSSSHFLYLKITPDLSDSDKKVKKFGIKDLKFIAQLKTGL